MSVAVRRELVNTTDQAGDDAIAAHASRPVRVIAFISMQLGCNQARDLRLSRTGQRGQVRCWLDFVRLRGGE